jgi:antitoxin ParD1/3/4
MSSTQKLGGAPPFDMGEVIEAQIKSDAQSSVFEVVHDGARAPIEREAAVEQWIRDELIAGHQEYMAGPSKGIPAEAVLDRIKARRTVRQR